METSFQYWERCRCGCYRGEHAEADGSGECLTVVVQPGDEHKCECQRFEASEGALVRELRAVASIERQYAFGGETPADEARAYATSGLLTDAADRIATLERELADAQRREAEAEAEAEARSSNICGVCCGEPLPSGKLCVCGGAGTLEAEAQGLREALYDTESREEVYVDDVRELLLALGLGDHARPYSAHEVVQRDVLPAIRELAEAQRREAEAREAKPDEAWVLAAVRTAFENQTVLCSTEAGHCPECGPEKGVLDDDDCCCNCGGVVETPEEVAERLARSVLFYLTPGEDGGAQFLDLPPARALSSPPSGAARNLGSSSTDSAELGAQSVEPPSGAQGDDGTEPWDDANPARCLLRDAYMAGYRDRGRGEKPHWGDNWVDGEGRRRWQALAPPPTGPGDGALREAVQRVTDAALAYAEYVVQDYLDAQAIRHAVALLRPTPAPERGSAEGA